MLEREIQAFDQMKLDLEEHHMHKFVVIRDAAPTGTLTLSTPPTPRPSAVLVAAHPSSDKSAAARARAAVRSLKSRQPRSGSNRFRRDDGFLSQAAGRLRRRLPRAAQADR